MNNEKNTFHLRAKVHNILITCLDCAGVELSTCEPQQYTFAPIIKKNPATNSYYVDFTIEEYNEEQLAYFVGFLAERIGMKNIWFDSYPKSGRVDFELNVPMEILAR